MRILLVLALCAAATTARADGWYFEEGLGGTQVKDDLAKIIPSAIRLKVGVGRRVGNWSTELFFSPHFNTELGEGTDYAATTYPPNLVTGGLDFKYAQPVTQHLEVYLRGSVTIATGDAGFLKDYSGRGLGVGAGIQLKGKGSVWGLAYWPLFWLVKSGPKMTGALWLDTGYEYYRLHGPSHFDVINAQLSHITGGFAVGTDF